jgi:uncharacterized RDD family membrane protein YckC
MNNPYAPPTARVGDVDAQGAPDDYDYGGFWLRFLASIIDNILIGIVIGLISAAIVGALFGFGTMSDGYTTVIVNYSISTLLTLTAIVLFWRYKQGSPGKLMLSMRVVDAKTLGTLSWGQCFGRYFAYFVSALPLLLGFMWAGWDPRKQAWHDKLAGTVVIRVYK